MQSAAVLMSLSRFGSADGSLLAWIFLHRGSYSGQTNSWRHRQRLPTGDLLW